MKQDKIVDSLNQAVNYVETGNYDLAFNLCRQILKDQPAVVNTKTIMAKAMLERKQYPQALAMIHEDFCVRPNDLHTSFTYASILSELGVTKKTVELLHTIIKTYPDTYVAYNLLGYVLTTYGDFQGALPYFLKSFQINPNDPLTNRYLGVSYASLRSFTEAEHYFRQAIRLDPSRAERHHELSTVLLVRGDYKNGWALHDKMYQVRTIFAATHLWKGSAQDISNQILLVWCVGGFGDILQYLRFIPFLIGIAKKIILLIPPSLVQLCQNIKEVDYIVQGNSIPDFDVHCPILSLPYLLGITLDNLPNQPYLAVPRDLQTSWQAKLDQLIPAKGLKAGLVWAGGDEGRSRRSMRLAKIAEIGQIPGITFISLQKDETTRIEAKNAPADFPLVATIMDEVTDLADTAAIIKNLDLVISVDTAVVHLAGGLGVPVWILNRFDACWRWLDGRDDSPWYHSAKLYRQIEPGNWSEVLTRVRNDLITLAATRPVL